MKKRDKASASPCGIYYTQRFETKDCCFYIKINQICSRVGSKRGAGWRVTFEKSFPRGVRLPRAALGSHQCWGLVEESGEHEVPWLIQGPPSGAPHPCSSCFPECLCLSSLPLPAIPVSPGDDAPSVTKDIPRDCSSSPPLYGPYRDHISPAFPVVSRGHSAT